LIAVRDAVGRLAHLHAAGVGHADACGLAVSVAGLAVVDARLDGRERLGRGGGLGVGGARGRRAGLRGGEGREGGREDDGEAHVDELLNYN